MSEDFEFVIKESKIVLENQMYVSPKGFIEINKFIDRYVEQQKKIQELEAKLAKAVEALRYIKTKSGDFAFYADRNGLVTIVIRFDDYIEKTLEEIEKGE